MKLIVAHLYFNQSLYNGEVYTRYIIHYGFIRMAHKHVRRFLAFRITMIYGWRLSRINTKRQRLEFDMTCQYEFMLTGHFIFI